MVLMFQQLSQLRESNKTLACVASCNLPCWHEFQQLETLHQFVGMKLIFTEDSECLKRIAWDDGLGKNGSGI